MNKSMSMTTSRRRFLQVGVGAVGVVGAVAVTRSTRVSASPVPPTPVVSGARTLVVLELAGGHDGYSMVIPYTNGAYYRRRPQVSHPPEAVIPIDASLGWNPNLARLARRPVAVVDGVGAANTYNSHEMLHRWWQGDTDGLHAQATGFYGRLCDVVGDVTAPAVGVCIGTPLTPALTARTVAARSVPIGGDAGFPGSWEHGMGSLPASTRPYPPTRLGAQLATAMQVIRANVGTRVIVVPIGGGLDFDTHQNHRAAHDALMTELDGALDAFLDDLDTLGLTPRVLCATFSEFGRRANQNPSGLDHGTTSVMLMCGAVTPGVYGAAPSWTSLDRDGQLVSPVGMGEYYAVMASFLGVRPGDVLPDDPTPVPGIVRP
jgi:uncharacterized protein (DUF1501 family)